MVLLFFNPTINRILEGIERFTFQQKKKSNWREIKTDTVSIYFFQKKKNQNFSINSWDYVPYERNVFAGRRFTPAEDDFVEVSFFFQFCLNLISFLSRTFIKPLLVTFIASACISNTLTPLSRCANSPTPLPLSPGQPFAL